MANSNELQTLAQVSSEIDESEVKITFANQCIKAQEALVEKLKEEINRRKEVCHFKKNENFRLEAEIKNAELEMENLRITQTTIRATSTEKKRELLLVKEKKTALIDRINKGEKKYEDLWVQCKKKYENIPIVKKLTQGRNKVEELQNDVNALENETRRLHTAINIKKDVLAEKDRKLIIQLATFIVEEMPATIKAVEAKSAQIHALITEIEDISKTRADFMKASVAAAANKRQVEEKLKINDDMWPLDNSLMIPKLQLPKVEIDITSVKLDLNKVTLHTTPIKRTVSMAEIEKNTTKRSKAEESVKNNYISCYFNKIAPNDDEKEQESAVNYSHRKLINILEDIKIDDNETYELVAKANIDAFQEVSVIVANEGVNESEKSGESVQKPLEGDVVEEINLTNTKSQDILIPPTQFSDSTQGKKNEIVLQENEVIVHRAEESSDYPEFSEATANNKKKVSFELPMEMEIQDVTDEYIITEDKRSEQETPNDTVISQLDLSGVDDNFMAIKDMILKKHQLDLSPQFVYAKNTMFQKVDSTQKTDEKIVTSKFFDSKTNKDIQVDNEKLPNVKKANTIDQGQNQCYNSVQNEVAIDENIDDNVESMDANDAISSPKIRNDKPVSGLLFTHGPQGIPDCLDISMSTTGYEDGDQDLPTCLDSSLLLSPKADMQPMSGTSEVISQEVPNFLSGFRKTGLSFFKQNATENNPDSSKENSGNNFNFNFGSSDEKKSRGGLFSFFR